MNALKKISIQRRSKCQALEHSISIAAAEKKKGGGKYKFKQQEKIPCTRGNSNKRKRQKARFQNQQSPYSAMENGKTKYLPYT